MDKLRGGQERLEKYEQLRLKVREVKYLKAKCKFGKKTVKVIFTPSMKQFMLMENETNEDRN